MAVGFAVISSKPLNNALHLTPVAAITSALWYAVQATVAGELCRWAAVPKACLLPKLREQHTMGAGEQLQSQYAEKSVHLASETLLSLGEAIRFVQDCQSLSIPIIGMELFERVDDGIIPVGLADYSQASRMNDCVEATTTSALAFLTGQLSKEILIVFTVGEAVGLA